MVLVVAVSLLLVLSFFFVSGVTLTNGEPDLSTPGSNSPGGGSNSPGGGGASLATANTTTDDNTTADDTADDDAAEDEGSPIAEAGEAIGDFIKGLGWKVIVIILGVVAVVGGTTWYVLKDKRKRFVEVRVKK